MGNTQEKRHNIMTQMTSLLAVATVLLAYGLILQSGTGEGANIIAISYVAIRETKVMKVEFELKVLGAYARGGGGGVFAGKVMPFIIISCVWEAMRGDSYQGHNLAYS